MTDYTKNLASPVVGVLSGRPPRGFTFAHRWGNGYAYLEERTMLKVIVDAEEKEDGRVWLHVSYSFRDRIPQYLDTIKVKNLFVGPGLKAIMVFPEEREHVNLHPYCLHLFACLSEDPLPDFTGGTGAI